MQAAKLQGLNDASGALVSYMHHLRRHAHRVAKLPRSTWTRVYRYREDRVPGYNLPVITPLSEDAPYGDEDAHFWDWAAAIVILVIVVGFAIWGITAWA